MNSNANKRKSQVLHTTQRRDERIALVRYNTLRLRSLVSSAVSLFVLLLFVAQCKWAYCHASRKFLTGFLIALLG